MERIQQAIERARDPRVISVTKMAERWGASEEPDFLDRIHRVELRSSQLESRRIVSHNNLDARSRPFDMLRAQVLQAMDKNGWQFLAVTSPTAGCGKSVLAINLALSIARQSERKVVLVDLDLQRPKVAEYLGVACEHGVLSVLEGRASLADAAFRATSGPYELIVLPGEICTSGWSEWMSSRAMAATLQTIRREFKSQIIIFDLPPILAGDDVVSILPQIDSLLLVAGVGTTKPSDIEECNKHLRSKAPLRVVVNKVPESGSSY